MRLKLFGLAVLAAVGSAIAVPALAQPDGYFGFGGRSGPGVEFFIGHDDGFGRHDRHRDWRGDRWDRRDDDRRWHRGRGCSAERALWKAERMGVRRARVVDVDRRTIDVVGRSRGDRVYLTFARVPGCPLIR